LIRVGSRTEPHPRLARRAAVRAARVLGRAAGEPVEVRPVLAVGAVPTWTNSNDAWPVNSWWEPPWTDSNPPGAAPCTPCPCRPAPSWRT
ncbi:hypothetical protein, partial [Streptomyces calidiresistens]|uniref:hypothetical protein n=1 Tax=Streptomyces calidiresistens TaxID=1485586 RepID=UPI003F693AC9